MRIARSDPRALVIVDFPFLLPAVTVGTISFIIVVLVRSPMRPADWLIALLICGSFLAFGAWLTKRTVFHFDLETRQLRWKRRGVFGGVGGVVDFNQIRLAEVQTNWSYDVGRTWRVALQTTAGDLPLTDTYTGGGDEHLKRICTAINHALQPNTGAVPRPAGEI